MVLAAGDLWPLELVVVVRFEVRVLTSPRGVSQRLRTGTQDGLGRKMYNFESAGKVYWTDSTAICGEMLTTFELCEKLPDELWAKAVGALGNSTEVVNLFR